VESDRRKEEGTIIILAIEIENTAKQNKTKNEEQVDLVRPVVGVAGGGGGVGE
jgi:hypothetical protein